MRGRLGICISLAILFLSLVGCAKKEKSVPVAEIRDLGHLELAEVVTEEIIVIKGNTFDILGAKSLHEIGEGLSNLLRVGDRVGVYQFDRNVVAYIDLTKFGDDDVVLNETGAVEVTLPPVEVMQKGRIPELKKLHERVSGTQRPISSEERRRMAERASEVSAKAFLPGEPAYEELVKRAERKGKTFVKEMLHARGYEDVKVICK